MEDATECEGASGELVQTKNKRDYIHTQVC